MTEPEITVKRIAEDDDTFSFLVLIGENKSQTEHTVRLAKSYCSHLAGDSCSPERLVEESFKFLLEHEPKEAILRSFDLPVIGRYFPEYEKEIARRL